MHKKLFKSHKTPAEVVKALREAILSLGRGDRKVEKVLEEISKHISWIKNLLFADIENGAAESEAITQLAEEIYQSDIQLLLIKNLAQIEFECRKDVSQVFNCLLRRQIGDKFPTVDFIEGKTEIVLTLLHGFESQDIALVCGVMLRECVRYEVLAKFLLYSNDFYNFFKYVEVPTFDVASDAFVTFKDLLTKHKQVTADFLEVHYDLFFTSYQKLLLSENYVTRRQSLNLLGELLLDRHNYSIMTKYIGSTDNLKQIMKILKEQSRNIQFEAFHVFKIFVANPHKPPAIVNILVRNQTKLTDFLTNFQHDRTDDEQFQDEKAYLIKQVKELKPVH